MLAARSVQVKSFGVAGLSVLLLVFYPEELRQSVSGELFTAFFGIAFLFVVVRAISSVLSPTADAFLEDLLDDLAAIYLWLKAHAGTFRVVFVQLEKVCTLPFIAPVLRWLNPRKHPWNLTIVLGVLIGAGLALIEGLSEVAGFQYVVRFLPIVAVFIGLECIGVLLGYVLFAQPLRLFRVQPALKHVL